MTMQAKFGLSCLAFVVGLATVAGSPDDKENLFAFNNAQLAGFGREYDEYCCGDFDRTAPNAGHHRVLEGCVNEGAMSACYCGLLQDYILHDNTDADTGLSTRDDGSNLNAGTLCVNGSAGGYPCDNVNLLSFIPLRLFDADAKHPVVEAHVRFYCIMKHRPVPRPLRLLQPDDDLGGMLFLSFPTVVNHHVDLYSLLHPPTASMTMTPHGLPLRQADGATANRDDVICPVCGESYGTLERWKNHVKFSQIAEEKDEWPVEGTHLSLNMSEIEQQTGLRPTDDLEELKEYFQRNVSEVICVTEGIDPLTSGTFQSLQSYRFEDIVWEPHSQFAPCMAIVENSNSRCFQVDLNRYHDIVIDEEAALTAKKLGSPTSPSKAPRERRRRIKTISRRQSDGLFDA